MDRKAKLGGFLENYHNAFTEYQGKEIAHWNFDDHNVPKIKKLV